MKLEDLEKIEDLIKSGQSDLARKKLLKINISKLARNRVSQVALLCRRAGLAEQALKILKSVVRPKNPQVQATANEIAIYANALAGIGGSDEAIRLLSQEWVLAGESKSHLYLAFALFSKWNYQDALPHLESFLERTDPSTYFYQIGQVNKLAALVTLGLYDEALALLEPLQKELHEKGHSVLEGNCKELKAQIFYHKKNFTGATDLLEEALKLSGNKYPDALFALKWLGLIELQKSKGKSEKLHLVKDKAQEFNHFETLRDIDLNTAIITGNEELLNKVYYGSPFIKFRESIEKRFSFTPDKQFERYLGGKSKAKSKKLKITSLVEGDQAIFKLGSLYQRMFTLLASDFYRPQRIPTLFTTLYPDEYFDAEYSAKKVVMLISRIRKVISSSGLNITEQQGKGYSISTSKPLSLIYDLEKTGEHKSQQDLRYEKLKETFGTNAFQCNEVALLFNVNKRTALRYINELIESGCLLKSGVKKGVRYSVTKLKDPRSHSRHAS